jgi:hypothetical protein
MQTYIGTKTLKATPMNKGDYNDYRGWETPLNKDASNEGYLVEYLDGGEPNDSRHQGYISWSPKDVFDKAYRPIENLTFGQALEAVKVGKRIARKGWNGKNMFLWMLPAGEVPKSAIHDPALRAVIDEHIEGDFFTALPTMRMWTRNAEGRWGVLTGWLASQTDMFSDDWMIVE